MKYLFFLIFVLTGYIVSASTIKYPKPVYWGCANPINLFDMLGNYSDSLNKPNTPYSIVSTDFIILYKNNVRMNIIPLNRKNGKIILFRNAKIVNSYIVNIRNYEFSIAVLNLMKRNNLALAPNAFTSLSLYKDIMFPENEFKIMSYELIIDNLTMKYNGYFTVEDLKKINLSIKRNTILVFKDICITNKYGYLFFIKKYRYDTND